MSPTLRRAVLVLLLAALAMGGCQRYAAANEDSAYPCRFRPLPLVVE